MADSHPWRTNEPAEWPSGDGGQPVGWEAAAGSTGGPNERDDHTVALPDTPATITKVLVGLIVAVFALGLLVGQETMFVLGAKINEPILAGGQYHRLLTVMFLHANLMHLALNGYALWVFGAEVERFYGHLRFAVVFFLGGLTASVASLALTPGQAVGASGAVFAIFAAEMVLLYRNRALFGEVASQRLRSLAMLLVLNAAIGFAGSSFIDNWAHIGGFLGGAVVGWLVVPTFRVAPPPDGLGPAVLVEDGPAVAWLTVRAG
jgi:rhomboid protease GluP